MRRHVFEEEWHSLPFYTGYECPVLHVESGTNFYYRRKIRRILYRFLRSCTEHILRYPVALGTESTGANFFEIKIRQDMSFQYSENWAKKIATAHSTRISYGEQ